MKSCGVLLTHMCHTCQIDLASMKQVQTCGWKLEIKQIKSQSIIILRKNDVVNQKQQK